MIINYNLIKSDGTAYYNGSFPNITGITILSRPWATFSQGSWAVIMLSNSTSNNSIVFKLDNNGTLLNQKSGFSGSNIHNARIAVLSNGNYVVSIAKNSSRSF